MGNCVKEKDLENILDGKQNSLNANIQCVPCKLDHGYIIAHL